jgi:hypothetical protein
MNRVKARLKPLIDQVDNELGSLTPCERSWLDQDLRRLRGVLKGMLEALESPGHNLELYHYDFGSDSDAIASAWNSTVPWYDDELRFNDRLKWEDLSQERFDRLIFHELSHLFGTFDDERMSELHNAHTIERLMTSDLDVLLPYQILMKQPAQKKCAAGMPQQPPERWRGWRWNP